MTIQPNSMMLIDLLLSPALQEQAAQDWNLQGTLKFMEETSLSQGLNAQVRHL